jgi:hypothetical protein
MPESSEEICVTPHHSSQY